MNRPPVRVALLLALVIAGLAGCGKKKQQPAGTGASYTVRAEVEAVSGREITLHHEAVPGFVNAFGERAEMMSMSMPFGVTDGVAIEVARGDKVEVRFHTDWDADPALRIDAITKLPPDTALRL